MHVQSKFQFPKNMPIPKLSGIDIPHDLEVYWDRRIFENKPQDNT